MLHAEVAENPARQHDKRLKQNVFMNFPTATRNMEHASIKHIGSTAKNNERQEDDTGKQGIKKQYWYNSITPKGMFLQRIIATQQGRRHKC